MTDIPSGQLLLMQCMKSWPEYEYGEGSEAATDLQELIDCAPWTSTRQLNSKSMLLYLASPEIFKNLVLLFIGFYLKTPDTGSRFASSIVFCLSEENAPLLLSDFSEKELLKLHYWLSFVTCETKLPPTLNYHNMATVYKNIFDALNQKQTFVV